MHNSLSKDNLLPTDSKRRGVSYTEIHREKLLWTRRREQEETQVRASATVLMGWEGYSEARQAGLGWPVQVFSPGSVLVFAG